MNSPLSKDSQLTKLSKNTCSLDV